MGKTRKASLEPPRFENGKKLLIAGSSGRYTAETREAIPAQWERFGRHIGKMQGQVAGTTYGVCCDADGADGFDYVSGVEVSDFSGLPKEFSRVRIPARRYAVFSHREHVSTIATTVEAIWSKWLPQSGHEAAEGPFFERYGEEFDPRTGKGGVEIWIPIKA